MPAQGTARDVLSFQDIARIPEAEGPLAVTSSSYLPDAGIPLTAFLALA